MSPLVASEWRPRGAAAAFSSRRASPLPSVPLPWQLSFEGSASRGVASFPHFTPQSGYKFDFEIVPSGIDLKTHSAVTDLVDVAMLPKSIGGDRVSVDEDRNEDEHFARGVGHPSLSVFLGELSTPSLA